MVSFESEIYRRDNDDLVGVKVIVNDSVGDEIDSIQVTNKLDFDELVERLDDLDDVYVGFDDGSSLSGRSIDSILSNVSENVTINATSLSGLDVDDFSKPGHTHDDRYYTESEVDNLLNGKSNTSHTHTSSQISDADTSPVSGSNKLITSGAVYSGLNNKSDVNHTHPWTLISEVETSTYTQKLWYNQYTGMVELYFLSPPHTVDQNNNYIGKLVGNVSENVDTESGDLSNSVADYVPQFDITCLSRVTVSGQTYKPLCSVTLTTSGRFYGRKLSANVPDSNNVTGQFEVYMTYRCKQSHTS